MTSEPKVIIDIETEKALDKLKDILSQKIGKGARLRNVVEWMTKGWLEIQDLDF